MWLDCPFDDHHYDMNIWWVFLSTLFPCDDTSLSFERISLLWRCDGCPLSGTLARGTDWVQSSRTESWTSSQIFPHGFVLTSCTSHLTLGHTPTCRRVSLISYSQIWYINTDISTSWSICTVSNQRVVQTWNGLKPRTGQICHHDKMTYFTS